MKQTIQIVLISAVVGAVAAGAVAFGVIRYQKPQEPTNEELIKNFYLTENAVHVSPHSLRTKMMKGQTGDYVLVDLRSQEEYEREHIITAVNIPAYKDPNTSAYDEKDRIIGAFRALPKDKDVIVYCYSTPCMTGRKIGKMLAENGIYVKHLGIGWNEWRYFWNLWNHDGEAPTNVLDYVVSGKEPGVPKGIKELPSPCGEGDLSC
ncbi:TPA: hypothetical protein DEP31_02340 [Candidatus Azambacteria bacterium]|nr:hypothetical protein [Candidatus Azambacteria bacterium]